MEQVVSFKGMVFLAKLFVNNCHLVCTEINKVQFYIAIRSQQQSGFRGSVIAAVLPISVPFHEYPGKPVC